MITEVSSQLLNWRQQAGGQKHSCGLLGRIQHPVPHFVHRPVSGLGVVLGLDGWALLSRAGVVAGHLSVPGGARCHWGCPHQVGCCRRRWADFVSSGERKNGAWGSSQGACRKVPAARLCRWADGGCLIKLQISTGIIAKAWRLVASSRRRVALSATTGPHSKNRFGTRVADKGLGAHSGEVPQLLSLNLMSTTRGGAKGLWQEAPCCRGEGAPSVDLTCCPGRLAACWRLMAEMLWRLTRLIWPLDSFSCFSSMWSLVNGQGRPGVYQQQLSHTPHLQKKQKDYLENHGPHFSLWGNHWAEMSGTWKWCLGTISVTKGKSHLTDLDIFYNKIIGIVDKEKAVHVNYLNFSKTFSHVSHKAPVSKLSYYSLSGWTTRRVGLLSSFAKNQRHAEWGLKTMAL